MKLVVNTAFTTRREKLAQWTGLSGIAILLTGTAFSFLRPEVPVIPFITLIVGFLTTRVSLYLANRYLPQYRADTVVAQALKGLDDRYTLYAYALPVPAVLVEPGIVTLFLLKGQRGQVWYGDDGRWHHRASLYWRLVGRDEPLGDPEREAEAALHKMRAFFEKALPGEEVPMRIVVLFTNPEVELKANGAPLPALPLRRLKKWLRGAGRTQALSGRLRRQVIAALDEAAGH